MKSYFKKIFPPAFSFIIFFTALELLSKYDVISAQLIPPLSTVLSTLIDMRTEFQDAFFETTVNVIKGLTASILFGLGLSLLLSTSEFLKRSILPFAVFFQTVPIIAIAPLLVIYFGFGAPTVIAASMIVSIFPVIANTLIGLESTSPQLVELFKVCKATRWQIIWKLRLPAAYPSIYSGLKVACGLSVIGAIAGEFVAGGGLGALIDAARTQQRIDIVFAALLLLSVLGLGLIACLNWSHQLIQIYRPYGYRLKD